MNETGNEGYISAETVPPATQSRELVVFVDQPKAAPAGRTLSDLIDAYQTHPNSGYHKLRYHVRRNHESLLKRIGAQYGAMPLAEIRAAQLKAWHDEWSAGGKASIAQSMLGQVSTMSSFGIVWLEETECERISVVLSKMKAPPPDPRGVFLDASQVEAVRLVAHSWGWHSMALAQAIQFDLMLRQKDVIGEYVPFREPGESEIRFRGQKWLRGIRWDEVGADMVLTHVTSKRKKPIEADLMLCPMIVEELAFIGGRKAAGPIIINEITGAPWSAAEYRRKWRLVATTAGVPKEVCNMDSRAGAISEAYAAGIPEDQIRQSATHSSAAMTQRYNRNRDKGVRSNVLMLRAQARSSSKGAM